MKHRRLVVFVLLGSMISGTYASAQTDVKPNAATPEKIEVVLNGNVVKDGGYKIDGRAHLSISQLSDVLQAFVSWDDANKKIIIDKPNVDVFLFHENKSFTEVEAGKAISFSVYVQVDSLQSPVDAIRITITDPNGEETVIREKDISAKDISTDKDNYKFWYRAKEYEYNFKTKGNYLISCYLRQPEKGDFTLISKKQLPASMKVIP